MINLMKNAVQAMRDGGTLIVQAREEKGQIVAEVIDDGPGISAAVCERLFEPFFTTKEQGSGLGLAVVSKAVEESGGRIEIESEEGQGTVCRLWLPQVAQTEVEEV